MSKKTPSKKRPNSAFGLLDKMLADTAGNLLVTSALRGATLEEKMLIGSLIPTLLKIIRSTPGATHGILDKLFPEGATFELDGLGELQRAANVGPKSPNFTPEATKE